MVGSHPDPAGVPLAQQCCGVGGNHQRYAKFVGLAPIQRAYTNGAALSAATMDFVGAGSSIPELGVKGCREFSISSDAAR